MKIRTNDSRAACGVALALAAVGCSADDTTCVDTEAGECAAQSEDWQPGLPGSAPLNERLAQVHSDLSIGSKGPEVRAVHEYLTQYGYFPSAKLQKEYPSWQPVVEESPVAADVFDEQTALAVTRFQQLSGLPQTGESNHATLHRMQQPRCAVPDEREEEGESVDKWNIHSRWPNSTFTWDMCSSSACGPQDVTSVQALSAAMRAVNLWLAQTSLTATICSFSSSCSVPDVTVRFEDIGDGGVLGRSGLPSQGRFNLQVNESYRWSVADDVPTGSRDLIGLLIHEFGHAIGLKHSSAAASVMNIGEREDGSENMRALNLDDEVAVSTLYDAWTMLPGLAQDIAAGDNGPGNSAIWIIGQGPSNDIVWKWDNASNNWIADCSPKTGVRLAVDVSGRPWLVRTDGTVWRRTSSVPQLSPCPASTWQQITNGTADIAIGGSSTNHVWVIDNTSARKVWKQTGTTWTVAPAISSSQTAKAIGVDRDGYPWVVASPSGSVYRYSSNTPVGGSWQLRGQASLAAFDIDAGPSHTQITGAPLGASVVFAVGGVNSIPTGFPLWVWNQQIAGDDDFPDDDDQVPVARATWVQAAPLNTGAVAVAVDSVGQPWVISSDKHIFRRTK